MSYSVSYVKRIVVVLCYQLDVLSCHSFVLTQVLLVGGNTAVGFLSHLYGLIFPTDNYTNPVLPQTKLSNGLNLTRTVIMLPMHSPLTGLVVLVSRQTPRLILLDQTAVQEVSHHLRLHQQLISTYLAKIPTQCLPSLI